jgi:hypothetical protein
MARCKSYSGLSAPPFFVIIEINMVITHKIGLLSRFPICLASPSAYLQAHAQIPRFRLQLCPPGASNGGIVECCSNFRACPAQVLRSDKMNENHLEDQRQYNLALMQNCC